MNWSTLNITIETPMFLGGAIRESCQPDTQFVPSVRGALRSWFRALVGATTTSPAELLRLEGSVFGAATDDGGGGQSQVHIRLGKQRATVNRDANTCPRWLGPNANDPARKWLGYLLGQGLFTPGNQDEAARLRRDYVDAGQHLELLVRASDDQTRCALAASMWALQRFGGIGSRSRKGWGTIRIGDVSSGSWTDTERRWLSEPFAVEVNDVVDVTTRVFQRPPSQLTPGSLTPYAMLAEGAYAEHSIDHIWTSWQGALVTLGEEWRRARATREVDTARYEPKLKTPEWLDTVASGGRGSFGLGALGLPVQFKQNVNVTSYVDGAEARLASPVLFRVHQRADQKWSATVTAFHSASLPPGGTIKRNNTTPLGLPDVDARTRLDGAVHAVVAGCISAS